MNVCIRTSMYVYVCTQRTYELERVRRGTQEVGERTLQGGGKESASADIENIEAR